MVMNSASGCEPHVLEGTGTITLTSRLGLKREAGGPMAAASLPGRDPARDVICTTLNQFSLYLFLV